MAGSLAEEFKLKGNESFAARDYAKAIDWYSKAIGMWVMHVVRWYERGGVGLQGCFP